VLRTNSLAPSSRSSERIEEERPDWTMGREFAHLHPQQDGSLHMTLPAQIATEAYQNGWGEPHPRSGTPLIFAPRDQDELEVVWRLLRLSYEYAAGHRSQTFSE
jgi:Family of unknown function (DUF5519)